MGYGEVLLFTFTQQVRIMLLRATADYVRYFTLEVCKHVQYCRARLKG